VDVLKVELPINPTFIAGTRAFVNESTAYTRQEALEHFRTAASAAQKPLIYLSAGVTNEVFLEMLELAAEAGVHYCGVLCGRATWQGGIAAYARKGLPGLERWLAEQGTQHIQALNTLLARWAVPWWDAYGGRENLAVSPGN
jgi:tagatose 1,6-diphosphate aldolase